MPLVESAPDALARVYAHSVFELAREQVGGGLGGQAAIEQTLAELEAVLEMARSDAKFSEFLSSRILPAVQREKSLRAIFTDRVGDLTLRFLLVLNHKGRLGHLAAIIGAYDQLVQDAFGRVEVDLYTASPVSQQEVDAIRHKLKTILGKEPVVHPYTDGTMIGGIKLQVGDQLIDGSLATRLRRLGEKLATEGMSQFRERVEKLIRED